MRVGGPVWLVALALAACGADADPAVSPEPIAEARVLARDAAFGRLSALRLEGQHLWLADASGDPYLHVLDAESGAVLAAFGRRGDGPGEFRSVFDLLPASGGGHGVVVYDAQARRLTPVSLDSLGRPIYGALRELTGSPAPRRVAALGRRYVGWLAGAQERWSVFGLDGEEARVDGPLVGPSTAPLQERLRASADLSVCTRPAGDRFAVAYVSSGRIELHDGSGAFLGLADVPDTSGGTFAELPGGRVQWSSDRFYYAGCAGTDSRVFALFSGAAESGDVEGFAGSDVIQVYDWGGRYLGQFRLSVPLMRFALVPRGRWLVGSGVADETVYRFEIPAAFQVP